MKKIILNGIDSRRRKNLVSLLFLFHQVLNTLTVPMNSAKCKSITKLEGIKKGNLSVSLSHIHFN